MAKNKTAFVCNECGQDFPRWQGQCSACTEWNTITEVRLGSIKSAGSSVSGYAGAVGGGSK
ncbi:MAG: DNA repair protein RadA, partial [Shewanella sp.]